MFSYDVKFLTSEEALHLKNVDFKSFKYETKKRIEESAYDAAKRNYCERRGGHWRSPRPRQIRQLESKLHERSIVACEWTTDTLITIIFSSGVIVYLTVKPNTLDVTQILFDRYCVGKLGSHTVTGVVLSKTHLLFLHVNRLATLITFGKDGGPPPCRISNRDPHIQSLELGGGPRRTEKHVSWREGTAGLQVLVWSSSNAEPAPWSPMPEDHANIHLYQIDGQQMSLRAFHQLENETLSAELSQKVDNVIHIVEQVNCHKAGINLEWVQYDVSKLGSAATKLSSFRACESRASLPAPARAARVSVCERRLLLALIDGSLHVLHEGVGIIYSTRASFIATDVRWAGELVVAAEESGRLQCFDRALSLLHHHAKCVDLTSHLRDSRRMQFLSTRSAVGGPFILVAFSSGPLALLRITHQRLLTAWLQAGRSANAVALLRAMDWEEEGTECLWAVNKLVCTALRSGAGLVGAETAQAALGAFLSAAAPLPRAAARFAPPVHDLARKFFHHLLRRGCVEKALSLAVDLQAWDLCCDARWAARERPLALEAQALAAHYAKTQHDSECSDSCSECSSHSSTASEAETNTSSEIVKKEPPPLPRVSLPNHPTLMPVTITPNEQVTTHSIRPNLHQYFERENTIWTTNVNNGYKNYDKYKPVMQNLKWHDNTNFKQSKLKAISEVPSSKSDHHDDRMSSQFRNVFQTDLREGMTNTMYRYHHNQPSTSVDLRDALERPPCRPDKNKVKFSNTVTVAVMSEPSVLPETARELADSLPLSPPHKYLAAFAPLPPPPPAPPAPADGPVQNPLKIKVVHFGMV